MRSETSLSGTVFSARGHHIGKRQGSRATSEWQCPTLRRSQVCPVQLVHHWARQAGLTLLMQCHGQLNQQDIKYRHALDSLFSTHSLVKAGWSTRCVEWKEYWDVAIGVPYKDTRETPVYMPIEKYLS